MLHQLWQHDAINKYVVPIDDKKKCAGDYYLEVEITEARLIDTATYIDITHIDSLSHFTLCDFQEAWPTCAISTNTD